MAGLSSPVFLSEEEVTERAKLHSVMICTPSFEKPTWEYVNSLVETQLALERLGIKHHRISLIGCSHMARVRNELAAAFLQSPFSDLMFIDDDMGWRPESVVRLLASEHPFCGAPARMRTPKPKNDMSAWCGFPDLSEDGKLLQDNMGFVRFKRVGTGFVKLRRDVFTRMVSTNPALKCQGHPDLPAKLRDNYYRFFRFGELDFGDGFLEGGEDYMFCEDWRKLGGEFWVDPQATLSHIGKIAYVGSFSELMNL